MTPCNIINTFPFLFIFAFLLILLCSCFLTSK
nr:MAG TPA: hypothetical protein [Caudoviricetes sp.]